MKAVALICEFNPFHNGHLSLLERIKKDFPEKPIYCFMSAEFVQRGEAAFLPAADRARVAVRYGADAVFAVPVAYSLAPAQIYAESIIRLIETSQLADVLAFGSETGELSDIITAASNMKTEEFEKALRANIANKMPYPEARSAAYKTLYGAGTVIDTPNNQLAAEYLSAIRYLTPVAYKRISGDGVCSASDIRAELSEKNLSCMPAASREALEEAIKQGKLRNTTLADRLILYLLSTNRGDYADVPKDMSARIAACAKESTCLSEYYEKLSVKQYTKARLRRMTLCTALEISRTEQLDSPVYLKLLAAKSSVMSEIDRSCAIPVITGYTGACSISEKAKKEYEKNLKRELVAYAFSAENISEDGLYRAPVYIER